MLVVFGRIAMAVPVAVMLQIFFLLSPFQTVNRTNNFHMQPPSGTENYTSPGNSLVTGNTKRRITGVLGAVIKNCSHENIYTTQINPPSTLPLVPSKNIFGIITHKTDKIVQKPQ